MSPDEHPILPLLVDFNAARESLPDASMPVSERYPGGMERAREHLASGLSLFESTFDTRPAGCWPSEGAISTATLKLLEEAGFAWAASGEAVLRHSLRDAGREPSPAETNVAYQIGEGRLHCFFRDDALSDAIGFDYQSWHADDAVGDLVHRLLAIREGLETPAHRVVSIILDGENAWEHYPENAFYFLSALLTRLTEHPRLNLTTFAECLPVVETRRLDALVAGSWVYGTLSTWIGEPAKNRAWDLLVEAKERTDEVLAAGIAEPRRGDVLKQLAVCEGSDWFWWLGDAHPSEAVLRFDELFRLHLKRLYQLLDVPPPAHLEEPLSALAAGESASVMRRAAPPPTDVP